MRLHLVSPPPRTDIWLANMCVVDNAELSYDKQFNNHQRPRVINTLMCCGIDCHQTILGAGARANNYRSLSNELLSKAGTIMDL